MAETRITANGTTNTGNGNGADSGFMTAGKFGAIANGVGGLASAFPTPNADLNSNNQMAAGIRDGVSNALLSSGNPYAMAAGAAVKIIDKTGGFSDLSEGLGTGNDVLNGVTSFLLPGAGWFTPPTEEYEISSEMKSMASGYASSMKNAKKVEANAGGKIIFGRNLANSNTHSAKVKDNMISNIKENADADYQSMASMTQNNAMQSQYALQGGYSQALARAGKLGMRIEKAKKLSQVKPVFKSGGLLLNRPTPEEDEQFFNSIFASEIEQFQQGGKTKKQNSEFEEWVKDIPSEYRSEDYDLESAFELLPREDLDKWKLAVTSKNPDYYLNFKDAKGNYVYHLGSIAELPNGDFKFLKLGKEENNPELHWETDIYYDSSNPNSKSKTHDLVFDEAANRYFYRKKTGDSKEGLLQKLEHGVVPAAGMENTPEFKEGGQMNVIPEGNLHARLHHMDNADNLTNKGIPVVDKEGKQQAEIEVNEIILNLELTKKLEDLYDKYKKDETSNRDKEDLAIEAGKLLAKEIVENTDDRTGLMESVQ
jgi:hypothetical protein